MDSLTARTVHTALCSEIDAFAKKHGIAIKVGTFKYSGTGFSVTLTGKDVVETETGSEISAIARDMCIRARLDPNKTNFRGLTIVDYNSRARKTPWIVAGLGGKRYRIGADYARMLFDAADKVETPRDRAVSRMADEVFAKTGTYGGEF